MDKTIIEILYRIVVAGADNNENPLKDKIRMEDNDIDKELANIVNSTKQYDENTHEQISNLYAPLVDLYAQNAFAKGVAFALKLKEESNEYYTSNWGI